MKIVRKQLLNKFETPDDIRRSGKRWGWHDRVWTSWLTRMLWNLLLHTIYSV
jgi:hypothetical protein